MYQLLHRGITDFWSLNKVCLVVVPSCNFSVLLVFSLTQGELAMIVSGSDDRAFLNFGCCAMESAQSVRLEVGQQAEYE